MRFTPRCYNCDRRPAKKIPALGLSLGDLRVYCTLRCAAAHAVERIAIGPVGWCQRCEKWVDGSCVHTREEEDRNDDSDD